MEVLGYLGALTVGLSLGIFGAGGSIIAIPVLVYLFGIEPLHATTYSFFIIGCTALIGSFQNIRRRNVKVIPALFFAISGVISIYFIRTFVLQLIPENLFVVNEFVMTKNLFILFFFSLVMMVAGISMILAKPVKDPESNQYEIPGIFTLIFLGFSIGIVIAFAGVGGGFLITPALILFAKLKVKTAVGTSLCIISLNSFVGFFSSINLHDSIDWQFLTLFIAITGLGILGGAAFTKAVRDILMKRIFGWFVLIMSIIIVVNELSFKN